MKVLLTGGAGFIGSKVCAALLSAGHEATVFDNLSTGHRDQFPRYANFIEGDLRDAEAIDRAVKGHQAVIHLAAQAIVPDSVKDPQTTFDINLSGGQNLLEAVRKHDVERFVQSSTAAVYGTPKQIPIGEDDPKFPINPYGASKLAFEHLLHSYHVNYGLNVTLFRYFNPFGPGERHTPETHAVPNFIRSTLNGKPIPLYWGGHQERDFFYVDDIASAHVMGLGLDGFDYFNLGSGKATKVIDLVNQIFEISGKKTDIDDLGERPGDPPRLLADITKVQRVLGWSPVTSLKMGLERTIRSLFEFRPVDR